MKLFVALSFTVLLLTAQSAHGQIATNLEKSDNVTVVTVATNEPGRFIPGIPLSDASDVWTGLRVHFKRDDRATDYRVEVTYLKNGVEAAVIAYVKQHAAVLNADGSAAPEGADVRISKDILDFTVTKVVVYPLRLVERQR